MRRPALRVVLVEPPSAGTLAPLLENRPYALLPIGNRPLVAHTLSAFAQAGIRDVEIVSERFADRVAQALGDGSRWGVQLRHRAVADCARAWDLLCGTPAEPGDVLAWRMDVVPDVDDVRAVLAAVGAGPVEFVGLEPGPLPVRLSRGDERGAAAAVRLARVLLVRDAATFWRANLRALRIHGTRHHVERRVGRSAFVDALAAVNGMATLEEPCLIGAHTHVGAQARIGRDSVVGSDVHVGQGVCVIESVILAGTLIGPHLQLRRKIVDGPMIIDVETGTVIYIADPRIIGRLGATVPARVPITDRVMAALAAAFLLLPIAVWCAGRLLLRRPVLHGDVNSHAVTRTLDGGALLHTTRRWSLATRHPAWARAPWLLAVARGNLPMVADPRDAITGEVTSLLAATTEMPPSLAQRARALAQWLRSLLAAAPAGDNPGRSHVAPAC